MNQFSTRGFHPLIWVGVVILGLLMPTGSRAQSSPQVRSFTLEEAVRYALENNIGIGNAQINEQILEEQIKETKGRALPQVDVNGQYNDNFALPQTLLPAEFFGGEAGDYTPVKFGVRYGVQAGVKVSQPIFNKQLFTAIKSTTALQDLYQLNTLKTKQDLVENIAKLYLQVQITDLQRTIADANYARMEQLLEITQAQLENGIIKKTDLTQLKVNRANLQTQLEDIDFSKEQQLNNLKVLLNLPPNDSISLTENLTESSNYAIQDSLSLNANVQYRQLQQQQMLNRLEVKAEQATYFPSLSAFFNYGYQGQMDKFKFSGADYNDFMTGVWGLSLNVPLFDGLQRSHRVQQKKLEGLQLRRNQEQLENTIMTDYQNAINQLTLSERQVDNQQHNTSLANELYDVTALSFQEGVAPLTELLDAEASLREAQSNYLSALLQLKVSELDLLKTSGQLANLIES